MTRECEWCHGPLPARAKSRQRFCSYACSARDHNSRTPSTGADNPNWRGGITTHPLYSRYLNMLDRCYRPANGSYPNYGGRGITVCAEWREDFWAYVRDIGPAPDAPGRWTIDRLDNDGSYCPENCRWATYGQQSRNRRPFVRDPASATGKRKIDARRRHQAVLAVFYGVPVAAVAEHFGVSKSTVEALVNGRRRIV